MIELKYKGIDINITIETEATGCQELINDFYGFLIAIGYQPETVNSYIDREGMIDYEDK